MSAARSRVVRRASLGGVGALVVCLVLTAGAAGQSPSPVASTSPGVAPAATSTPDPALVAAAASKLADMTDILDVDRSLLIELRKKLPADRAEAEAYLANIERLALAADPVRLGVIVSRVRAAAPTFLDWRGQQFASQAEAQTAYVQGGAAAFDATWTNLRDEILLVVANRIDTIIDVVDEMQGGR